MPSVLNTVDTTGPGFNRMVQATREIFSAEIWLAALPRLMFDQFTTKRTELGTQPGRAISIPKFGNLKRGGTLTEGIRMETKPMSMSFQSIEVKEQGNAVAFSEYALQTSFYDNMSAASMLLGRDMALVLDSQLRNAATATTSVVFGGGRADRGAITVADRFTVLQIREAVETLETANIPKFQGDFYVCFIHPHQASFLRRDPEWTSVNTYNLGGANIFNGEIGRFEDVRFVSTTVMPNGANANINTVTGDYDDLGYNPDLVSDTGVPVYQAVMFGEYSVAHATGLPAELRDNGITDFGREHGLAWYAIWGSGMLDETAAVAIETA
jgi:N4-gp56 family major capsid protein